MGALQKTWHTADTVIFFILLAAIDPIERCAAYGDVAILGDLEKYKTALYLVKKDAPACVLYHAAMVKMRQAEQDGSGSLRGAAKLLERIDATAETPVYDWARVRRLEIALRLQEPDLAPNMEGVPAHLPSPERRWLMETSLLGYSSPDAALDAHAKKVFPRGRDRLMQIADMLVMLEETDSRRPPLLAELYRDYPDSWITPKDWPTKQLGPMPAQVLLDRLTLLTGRHANASVILTTGKALKEPLTPEVRCQVMYHRGVAFRKLREYSAAERALSEAVSLCQATDAPRTDAPKNDALKKAWFTLGQVQMIARPFDTARPTLLDFVAKYKDDPLADDALWFAVQSAEKAHESDTARTFIEQLVRDFPLGDMCAEANFRLSYDLYHAGDFAAAAERFGKNAQGPCAQDHVQIARSLYWQARALARAEQDAKATLAAAYATSPLSYYGMMARLRLGDDVPPLTPPKKTEPEMGPPTAASRPLAVFPVERVRTLTKLGLYAEAQAELQAAKPSDDADAPQFSALLAEAHDFHKAHFPFRKQLKPLLGNFPHEPALWHVAYPRPFEPHIRKAEAEEKLPRDLLLSLIREESAFQVDAGSWANAFGLTQLLVETAQRAAADARYDKPVSAEVLKKEGLVSLKLGSHLLGMLQKRFRNVPLMLAAYNAGEEAVEHWTRSRGHLPIDEFIEEIPIDETRGYVKRILWTWNVYRQLNAKDLPALSLGRAFKPVAVAQE